MRPDPRGPTTRAERTLESFKLFTRCLPVLRNRGRLVNRNNHFSSCYSVFRRTEHPPKSFSNQKAVSEASHPPRNPS